MAPTTDAAAKQRRDAIIQQAIREGRIHQFSAPRWRGMLDQDEAGTVRRMESLTPVQLVATGEIGQFSAPPSGAPQPSGHFSSNDPAAIAAFRQTALDNARRQEELDRIEAAELAETQRTMRAMGFGVA